MNPKPFKRHHFRYECADFSVAYCGKHFGPEVPKQQAVALEHSQNYVHCLRCLYGQQNHKGEMYVLERGFPLVRRIVRNSPFGGNLPPSYRLELIYNS